MQMALLVSALSVLCCEELCGSMFGRPLGVHACLQQHPAMWLHTLAELPVSLKPGTLWCAGVFGSVAYVQRINTLGGRIPGNFYSIPRFQSVNNYALAIPFQARSARAANRPPNPTHHWHEQTALGRRHGHVPQPLYA